MLILVKKILHSYSTILNMKNKTKYRIKFSVSAKVKITDISINNTHLAAANFDIYLG